MSDFLSPGDPLRKIGRSYNKVLEATSFIRQGSAPSKFTRDPCKIKVKNLTGDDLPKGSVVQLGAFLLDADHRFDDRYLWYEGNTPTDPGATERVVILRRPIPDGEIGEAFASGICTARINVNDTGHKFATPVDGETDLESVVRGPIPIMSPLAGTGSQQCQVLLGPVIPQSNFHYHAKFSQNPLALTSTISASIVSGTNWATSSTYPVWGDFGTTFVVIPQAYRIQVALEISSGWTQPADNQHHWAAFTFSAYVDNGSGVGLFSDVQGTAWILFPAKETGAASTGTAHTHSFSGATVGGLASFSGIYVKPDSGVDSIVDVRVSGYSASTGGPAIGDFSVYGSLEIHPIGT
jgi:hypothetical protein